MTKFRAGALLGFAAGYYLGARAGQARYEQINRVLQKVRRRSPAVDHAVTNIGRARAVVDLTNLRVQEAIEPRTAALAHR